MALASLSACGTRGEPDQEAQVRERFGVAPLVAAADAALKVGNYEVAIDAYAEALERTPWNDRLRRAWVAAHIQRAARTRDARKGIQPLIEAESDLRKALVALPDDSELEHALAVILLDRAAFEPDDELSERLRGEAGVLAPDLEARTPIFRAGVERRLDLAYELIERGQIDAGIDSLERLHKTRPDNTDVTRLLAQASVRRGLQFSERRNYARAAGRFARATGLYRDLLPCDGERCDSVELSVAHQNLIVSLIEARLWSEAEAALSEAERIGLSFPELTEGLREMR